MKLNKSPLAIFASAAALIGCATAPPLPEQVGPFPDGAFLAASDDSATFVDAWWTQFGDEDLNALIAQSLAANKSLEVAAANVRLSQQILARQTLERSVSTRTTANADFGRAARLGDDASLAVQAGLGASWEFDAFGRIAAQIAAAEYDVEAAIQAERDVAVIVASQTAQAYVDLRGAQRRLEVARENARTQAEGLDLLQTLLDNGRATRLDLDRAEAQYRTTLASLPRFEATVQTAVSALAVLTGRAANSPGANLTSLTRESADIPEHDGPILSGSVDQFIRRRPDIRQAEATIATQLALGKAARADLFPTVTLNADLLAVFDETSSVGDLNSFGFGIGPSISWAGPDLRRVRANIAINDARAELAIADYEQTVLTALGEVEIALTNYAKELERRNDLRKAAEMARRARGLAQLRFEEGIDDYLDVLDAQRTLLEAEDRLAESRLQSSTRAIAAYRALGGVGFSSQNAETNTDIALD